jgi:hypothetical protein
VALLGQLLPQWVVAVWVCMLSSGPGISSVVHQPSCFGVEFSPCWFTGGLFLCLAPFIWVKVRDPSASSLLSTCYDGLLIVFQFCSVVFLWVLLTGSGEELCGLLPALFQAAAYHLPAIGPSAFPAICLLKLAHRLAPCSSTLLWGTFSFPPPLLCASFQFIVYYSIIFLQRGGGASVSQGGYAGLSQGWLGENHVTLGTHLFVLPNVSQAGLEQASGGMGTLLFSQCNVAWRSFLWARGSGCQSFDSPWCFISAKCGSSISARFLIHRAHITWFCALLAILDSPS